MKHPVLGILGGLGPASGAYFYQLLIKHTKAARDADHLDVLLSGCASTPDRTDFILGKSAVDPLPDMLASARALVGAGADLLAIPCNTAHYFYDALMSALDVPVINLIRETVDWLADGKVKKIGLLATDGTVQSGAYRKVCEEMDVGCICPDAADQAQIMRIIYDEIKAGKPADTGAFSAVCERLRSKGCERLILGCTELSLLAKETDLSDGEFVDPLAVLACRCITLCGKEPVGFAQAMIDFERKKS